MSRTGFKLDLLMTTYRLQRLHRTESCLGIRELEGSLIRMAWRSDYVPLWGGSRDLFGARWMGENRPLHSGTNLQ